MTEQPPKEESEASKAVRLLAADDNVFQKTLRGLKRGTANGPLGDSIDLLRYCGLKREKFRHNVQMLVLEIGEGRLPENTVQFFNPNFFFALHKQLEDDTDLRPIGIATALRRLSSAHYSVCSSPYVASKLAPLQMGIGISGGIDFITMTARMKAEKYIHEKYGRTMAFLDLTNQFNNASREKLKEILTSDFPCLLGYFNAAYESTNRCWYEKPDGGWDFILQLEGYTQGDPLSGLFSSLILYALTKLLLLELDKRADNRLRQGDEGDDGQGGKTSPQSYLDDTNLITPHADLEFALEFISERGPETGIILSRTKNQFITSLNNDNPRDHSPYFRAHEKSIERVITKYGSKNGEMRGGDPSRPTYRP